MLTICTHKGGKTNSGITQITKKISLASNASCVFQLYTDKDYLSARIESIIIDTLLAPTTSYTPRYNVFQGLLEKLNKELTQLTQDAPVSEFGLFIALVEDEMLHFSLLGEYTLLLTKGFKVVNVGNDINVKEDEFSYVSSGKLAAGDVFFASPTPLLHFFTEDDIVRLAQEKNEEKQSDLLKKLLSEEHVEEATHLVVIKNEEVIEENTSMHKEIGQTLWISAQKGFNLILDNPISKKAQSYIESKVDLKQKNIRLGFFSVGLLVCAGLLYLILTSLLGTHTDSAENEIYKNRLIEAQQYLDKAGKDFANKDAFHTYISKTETILYDVRKDQKFIKEVDKMLSTITILKNQFYGIQSISLGGENTILSFSGIQQKAKFTTVGLFELNKKFFIVGRDGFIWPYVAGSAAKVLNYPDGEEAISADMSDGIVYILTKTHRVLKYAKGEFKYINVEGQKTWEEATSIKFFNSNLYLLASGNRQLYKHKPGVSGFSAKSAVIPEKELGSNQIVDFGLDGGVYLIKDNLMIDKLFLSPTFSRKPLVLNKLPENYKHSEGGIKIAVSPNLFYSYVLLNNTLWIFDPQTRNYKDVKSLSYVGQIEPTKAKIRAINVPQDGVVYLATDDGVYRIEFSSSDGKLLVR